MFYVMCKIDYHGVEVSALTTGRGFETFDAARQYALGVATGLKPFIVQAIEGYAICNPNCTVN
jgi:hypothetical protein